jgi:hypothetical protein
MKNFRPFNSRMQIVAMMNLISLKQLTYLTTHSHPPLNSSI